MNVLSLFNGMSIGQIALEKAGVKIGRYFSSEIKPHANKLVSHNYPKTIHLGDVRKIKATDLPKIDLLIGGSPCQDFSRGNKERLGLEGEKSSLFFEYVRLLEELKPTYFLLENVVMDMEDNNFISRTLGVLPVNINSSLVTAQQRNRYYWTNIQGSDVGLFESIISQPKDKKISLQSILENGYTNMEKARCLLESDSRPLATPVKMFHRYYSPGFTTLIFKSKKHFLDCKKHYDENYSEKSADEIICNTDIYDGVRYMTKKELEKCQTVPEGYTDILTRNEAASLLGDGWTVDVIAHIFGGLLC